MKLLSDILYKARIEEVVGSTNVAIDKIQFDSRKVEAFTVFVAIPGTQVDGHKYIDTAIDKGAVAVNGEEIFESGIQKNLKIVDLTGAGDLFAAGFLHGYVNNMSIKESLEKGTEMSSKIIQKIGARLK